MSADLIRRGIFRGVDLNALVARFWRLDAMRVEDKRLAPPEVRWICATRGGPGTGHAKTWSRKIVVRVPRDGALVNVVEVVLHELVHVAHYLSFPKEKCHGEMFCRRLIACAREAFGLELDTAALLTAPIQTKGSSSRRAYDIDRSIEEAMWGARVDERLREDPESRFDPPPPETEEQVTARLAAHRQARIEKRAARARAKLIEWERRALVARRHGAKWRVKVRYYDRRQIAAKAKDPKP